MCGRLSTRLGSVWGVIGGIVVSAGAVAEMGWENENWFSLRCVSVCDWWNCCVSWSRCRDGAVAEMGWGKASFNCTGVRDKDVVLDKATAAVLADIS